MKNASTGQLHPKTPIVSLLAPVHSHTAKAALTMTESSLLAMTLEVPMAALMGHPLVVDDVWMEKKAPSLRAKSVIPHAASPVAEVELDHMVAEEASSVSVVVAAVAEFHRPVYLLDLDYQCFPMHGMADSFQDKRCCPQHS